MPVLDLANHTPRPQYEHRVDPSKGAFSLFVDAAHVQQQQQQPGQDARSRSDQQQMLITYGSKDNRCVHARLAELMLRVTSNQLRGW